MVPVRGLTGIMPERKIKSPALRQAAYRASGARRLLQDSCAISSCHTRRWVNLPWLTTRRAALFKGQVKRSLPGKITTLAAAPTAKGAASAGEPVSAARSQISRDCRSNRSLS